MLHEFQPRAARLARYLGALLAVPSLLVAVPAALANLRAPVVIPDAPSTALSAPGPGLVVSHETLTFHCKTDTCAVEATYRVQADAPVSTRLEFILPGSQEVLAGDGAHVEAAAVQPAKPLTPAEAEQMGTLRDGAPELHKAMFPYDFQPGENQVVVRYTQLLGATEMDYGYFKTEGRFLREFRYEIWPLKQWKRSKDFAVDLAVTIDREEPSWWTRLFGDVETIRCLSEPAGGVIPGALTQKGGQLWFEARLTTDLPDRVRCHIGDEDLMPGGAE